MSGCHRQGAVCRLLACLANRLGPSSLNALDFKKDDFPCKSCLCLNSVCKLVPELPLIHKSSACMKRAPLVAGEERRAVRAKRRGGGRGGWRGGDAFVIHVIKGGKAGGRRAEGQSSRAASLVEEW